MQTTPKPRVVVANRAAHELAEGPFWDPIRGRVLWVDIRRGVVRAGELRSDGSIDIVDEAVLPGTVGAVAVDAAGHWLIAGVDRLWVRHEDGSLAEGPVVPLAEGRRLNDGKPDPAGRFVVGSLCLTGPSESEVLVVVDHDGRVRELDRDLTLSNGLAWTGDGHTLYSIDTERRRVHVRSYDPATGEAGPRSVLFEVDEGHPDGMCLDTEGHLWLAVWGSGEVRRYAPDGALVATIEVPAPHVSSVSFAGPALDTLVITTATQDLDGDRLARFPLSGRVFTCRPGSTGLPQSLWSGSVPELETTRAGATSTNEGVQA